MSNVLSGKIVLVTGANRGIGKEIVAGALARGAAKVYAAVRRLDSAQPLVAEFGARVVPLHLDLEDSASISSAAKTAADVHIVINNAGVARNTGVFAPDAVEAFQYEVNINVIGLIHVARAFAPVLKTNGGGTLVQLNSVVSIKSFANLATYSASKAASYSITQALKDDLAEQGTQVVSVHPGPIATDMAREAGIIDMAVPPSVVVDALFDAVENDTFHAFPDPMAQQFWQAYRGYAEAMIETTAEHTH